MILYLTSKDKVNLLDFSEPETGIITKKLVGKFSLMQFIVKDMRNFSHFKYFVIDRKAIIENDTELIQAIASFQMMNNSRIILIDEKLKDGHPLITELIQTGVTNLITANEIEGLQEEILECLSLNGMQRFQPPLLPLPPKDHSISITERYQFNCINITIAIAGSDRRTGVTTTAINLVCWVNIHGGTACYLEANTSKHLAHIVKLFQPDQNGNAYVLEGQDFYFTREFNRAYNFIIVDCGVLGEKQLQEEFINADIRILCGSAMPYELPVFYRAIERCKNLHTQVLGLYVPEDLQIYFRSTFSDNIIFGGCSHELFDSEANSLIYRQLLGQFSINK